jgi:uncharacterized protein with GYD domain
MKGRNTMATFITRGRLSAEAVKGLINKPEDRHEAVSKLIEAAGGKLLNYYVTTGDTDFLLISEADDGESAVAAVMAAAAADTVTDVTTSRAWTSAEFKSVAEKAGAVMATYRAPGQG